MRSRHALLVLVLALGAPPAAGQLIERLDDSASPRQLLSVDWRWAEPLYARPRGSRLTAMWAQVSGVEIRLDTSAHVGRSARIYLRLPPALQGLELPRSLSLSWQTQGVFSQGRVGLEQRALIFQGMIEQPQLRDVFDLMFEVDGDELGGPLNLDLVYEIEVL